MKRFDLAEANGNLTCLFQRAPHRAENHHLLVVIFQMAAFVAVNVKNLAHGVILK